MTTIKQGSLKRIVQSYALLHWHDHLWGGVRKVALMLQVTKLQSSLSNMKG